MTTTTALDTHPAVEDQLLVACGLALAAGIIHVVAAVEHFRVDALHAAFFAILAVAQLAWSAARYRAPSRGLLLAGVIVSVLVAVLWAVSRTVGVPSGGAWTVEPVGVLDVVATADELALALLTGLKLAGTAVPGRARAQRVVMAVSVGLLLVSSLVLVGPAHGH